MVFRIYTFFLTLSDADISINMLFLSLELKELDKSPSQKKAISPPQTDLINHHTYKQGKIKFNIWLSKEESTPIKDDVSVTAKAQIWISKIDTRRFPQLALVTPISNEKRK